MQILATLCLTLLMSHPQPLPDDVRSYAYWALVPPAARLTYADIYPATEIRITLGSDATGKASERSGVVGTKSRVSVEENFGPGDCPNDWLCLPGMVGFAIPLGKFKDMRTWSHDIFTYEHITSTKIPILGYELEVEVISAVPTGNERKATRRLFYFSMKRGLMCIAFYHFENRGVRDVSVSDVSIWWTATPFGFGALTLSRLAQQE